MEIRLASLSTDDATGTVVVIDVFRAFTTAAIALSRGAKAILMVNDLARALALCDSGIADASIGERKGAKPPGFDFGNSPAELSRANVAGKTLVQTTSNGTAGLVSASRADRLYAGSFVTAEATVQAILREEPQVVTIAAMGREGKARADEDELCALYLRSRLEGRSADLGALRTFLLGLAPPPDPKLVASGDYDGADREIALQANCLPFAVRVTREHGHLVARRDGPPVN